MRLNLEDQGINEHMELEVSESFVTWFVQQFVIPLEAMEDMACGMQVSFGCFRNSNKCGDLFKNVR